MATATSGLGEIARRYATALFELADSKKKLDAVADDLRGLATALDESEDLRRLLRSPTLSRDAQGAAMAAVLEKAGADPLTRNFVGLLARNRRLFVLAEIIKAYLSELAQRRGELTARVTTATSLSKTQEKALADTIKQAVGSKVSLEVREDPSLLAGLIVQVGSRMVDSSLRTKLQRLKLAMKGVG